MIKKVINIESSNGNNFAIELSSYDKKFFSEETWRSLNESIEVVNIDLVRVSGNLKTSLPTLSEISSAIADFFLSSNKVIICFYCDFLSPIPNSNKKITCQKYRSLLFKDLFNRCINRFHINGVKERIITISGVEDYFVHIIYREEHKPYVDVIASGIHEGYDKP